MNERYSIKNVFISITNPQDAVKQVEKVVSKKGKSEYICVSNMRMVRLGNKDKAYRKVMNDAYMVLPDGLPLTWCGKAWGLKNVERVTGPDFFHTMLQKNDDLKHFLLGDTDEILMKLKNKYPAKIVGTYSPPFVDVQDFDYPDIIKRIEKSGANIVWVAMRAPKQDLFNSIIVPSLKNKICIGVGRAFRIEINEVKDAPNFAKKMGIAGIFTRRKSLVTTLIWYFESFFYLLYYLILIFIYRFLLNKK